MNKKDDATLWRDFVSNISKRIASNDPEHLQNGIELLRDTKVCGQLSHIAESGMGKLVRSLTKSEHEGVATAAKQTIAAWRRVLMDAKKAAAASEDASTKRCVFKNSPTCSPILSVIQSTGTRNPVLVRSHDSLTLNQSPPPGVPN
jgi:hypothetical protein